MQIYKFFALKWNTRITPQKIKHIQQRIAQNHQTCKDGYVSQWSSQQPSLIL